MIKISIFSHSVISRDQRERLKVLDCFLVQRSAQSREAAGKKKVLECTGKCVLGQMCHEKSTSVRLVESFGLCFA